MQEDYISGNLLPRNQLHILGGDSGAGKTVLTALVVKSIVEGHSIFGQKTHRPKFIGIVASDRTDNQKWYKDLKVEGISHYSLLDDNFDTKEFETRKYAASVIELLEKIILDKLKPPSDSLLVVDPIALFIGGDSNSYTKVYAHLAPLNQMLIRRGWTIWGIHHAAKLRTWKGERPARPEDRLLGSTALQACAGTVYFLQTEQETEGSPQLIIRPHHAERRILTLDRDQETGVLSILDEVDEILKRNPKHDEILELLSTSESTHVQTLLDKVDIPKSSLYRILGELEIEHKVHSPIRGFWRKVEASEN